MRRIVAFIFNKGLLNWLSDKAYLKVRYWVVLGEKLNLKNPQNYNEKIQWLKLYDRNSDYVSYVDKYEVKKLVSDIIGDKYIIKTYGCWESVNEIDFSSLPNQFVLKTTHDSGGVIICKDKEELDTEAAKNFLKVHLKTKFYKKGREWVYKGVKPRIIAEEYKVDESGCELKDYKIFCFNGEPKIIQVDFDRFVNHRRNIYDTNWNVLDVEIEYPSDKKHIIEKPEKLDEMLEIAKKLSKGIKHVRVDLYCSGKEIYFGELTFYHGSGIEQFRPKEFNIQMGKWIDIEGETEKSE